jgi:acetyl-CoA C-acetyltransferase
MNDCYVIGGAQTDFERNWTKEKKNVIALLREVIEDTLKSVNMTYDDIIQLKRKNRIGCFIGNFIGELFIDQGHLGSLLTKVHPAFYGVPSARYEAACASGSVALDAGISKIRLGDYDVSLVIGFELMKTKDSKMIGDFLGRAADYDQEAKGIDYPFPKLFGKLAERTIEKYSLDKEEYLFNLAKIVEKNYENAKRNSKAQTHSWFMDIEQAMARGTGSNPFVGGLLANSDCSQITDGAAAVICVSENYLAQKKISSSEVAVVKGRGHTVAPLLFEEKMKEAENSEYLLPWTRKAVKQAYQISDLSVDDIDVFETHDCFSSSEYVAISSFGITPPGLEQTAIKNGTIFFDSGKPINPSGGLIGCGHPVGASGVRMFYDLFKQVTGKAENYQVNGAKNGMMLNLGGSATTNYVFILGRKS